MGGGGQGKEGMEGKLYSGDRAEFWGAEPRPRGCSYCSSHIFPSLPPSSSLRGLGGCGGGSYPINREGAIKGKLLIC